MRQILELQPQLYALEVKLPDFAVRSLAVIGERQALIWDTLTCPADMAAFEAALAGKPFHIVYSHADWDHIWGSKGFSRPALNIIGHDACLRRFDQEAPATLSEMQEAEPGKWHDVELVPPNLTFNSRMSLDLGGLTLELHHLPGHSPDCIVGWIPQWGVLIGGDAIETPLPVLNDASLLPAWRDSLENWARKSELKRAIPAHGGCNGRESLDSTVHYLRRLIAGEPIEFATALDEFYRRTHEKNVALASSRASGR